jgi:hypothetical protein
MSTPIVKVFSPTFKRCADSGTRAFLTCESEVFELKLYSKREDGVYQTDFKCPKEGCGKDMVPFENYMNGSFYACPVDIMREGQPYLQPIQHCPLISGEVVDLDMFKETNPESKMMIMKHCVNSISHTDDVKDMALAQRLYQCDMQTHHQLLPEHIAWIKKVRDYGDISTWPEDLKAARITSILSMYQACMKLVRDLMVKQKATVGSSDAKGAKRWKPNPMQMFGQSSTTKGEHAWIDSTCQKMNCFANTIISCSMFTGPFIYRMKQECQSCTKQYQLYDLDARNRKLIYGPIVTGQTPVGSLDLPKKTLKPFSDNEYEFATAADELFYENIIPLSKLKNTKIQGKECAMYDKLLGSEQMLVMAKHFDEVSTGTKGVLKEVSAIAEVVNIVLAD